MNIKLIQALIKWAGEGHRSFKIECDNYDLADKPEVKIWCYTYEFKYGKFISCIDDIPTDEDALEKVIKDNKREYENSMAMMEAKWTSSTV